MFVLSLSTAVEAFTPSALPDFIAMPASIPATRHLLGSLSRLPSHTRSCSNVAKPRANVTAWLILCHCVLLDAVCDPGAGTLLVLQRPFSLYRASDVATVSPLSGECPHRAAHQCSLPLPRCPYCLRLVAKDSAFPYNHFGATYRIQLLSLHLANLSSFCSSRRSTPIRGG